MVLGQSLEIANDYQGEFGPSDGDVQSPLILQKAQLVSPGPHAAEDDDFLLSALEAVD